jgi:GTPase SAR1 family protein
METSAEGNDFGNGSALVGGSPIEAAQQNRSFSFKVVLLGEGCVGKTSLVLRYVEDKFNERHISTVQVILYNLYQNSIFIYFNS